MEGNPEDSDEDVLGEHKATVLWEKCIQQSIFVDLSEDESLHFSDLENSLALHLSQTESASSDASIHLSGSAELSDLDDTSSESSIIHSQSERVVENKKKCSILHMSVHRPNTMLDELPVNLRVEDPGENTSDEDQEDLPFDSDFGSPYFNQTGRSEVSMSSDGKETVQASPDLPGLLELTTTNGDDIFECSVSVEHNSENKVNLWKEPSASTKHCNSCDVSKPGEIAPSCRAPVDINQLLLLHFSQEELLQSGRLIEAETLPEVSLLESLDDSLFSLGPTQNSTAIENNHLESPAFHTEIIQSICCGTTDEKTDTAEIKSSSEEAEGKNNNNTSSNADSLSSKSTNTDSNQTSGNDGALDGEREEKAEEDGQDSRVPFVRTRFFSEMKYGQGQVHYPLPDFSKVSPKVKIPKAPSGPARDISTSTSTMHRAQSSAGMLEVISRVLEDSVLPSEKPYIFKEEDKLTPPALVHHLQAEYDKLLTKYAEAENLIDQMRLGTNNQLTSEVKLYSDAEYNQLQLTDDYHQRNLLEGSHLGSLASHLHPSENTAPPTRPEEDPSDGERMTAELRDVISQFMQSVKEFKLRISNVLVSTAEQQMMFKSMMEAQDQLERNYISKKEEHRALEMQNYIGLSRNTGTFDPDRLVEGDIFRIGMLLEDIKEVIDKNVYEQISPPHSSSTPMPSKDQQHVNPHPLCMATPSPTQSLYEEPGAVYSTVSYKVETQREEVKVEDTSKVHGDSGWVQSNRLITTDSFQKNTGCNSFPLWSPERSQEDRKIHTNENEERIEVERNSVLSDETDHCNILFHLNGFTASSRHKECTPQSSYSTLPSVLDAEGKCDLSDCVSLAVEVSRSYDTPADSETHSPLESPFTISSRIVSTETDSGFGSSLLASGTFQTNLLTESVPSNSDVVSCSDSEGSCSNLQTAIHSASQTTQQWTSPHPSVQTHSSGATVAVECWVKNTTKEPVVRLLGSESNLPAQSEYHVSAPVVSTTMDTIERDSQSYSCSCNSEAIQALQSEVSRLKKDLEEGLVQLPHLAQKMDYLTSKYRQDRQGRSSKIRPRTHQRAAPNSLQKPSTSRQNLSNLISSSAKIDDWISSDMDPTKSKGTDGTDGGDTTGSEIMLQFHVSPVGSRRGSGEHCGPKFQYKAQETLKSMRNSEGSVKAYPLSKGEGEKQKSSDKNTKQRPGTALMETFRSKESSSLLSSSSLQKPLLQVNYGSCSSLPASYKVMELPLQSMLHHSKRFTQSDTALLPSNVYFQRTFSPLSVSSKTGNRTGRRRGTKVEDINKTLDQAIKMAYSMKRTTEQMARRLSVDLAKAQLSMKLHNIHLMGAGNTTTLNKLQC
ncbi:microtubule organization protein AKNA-like isoform X2 [Channa argus]|uniref:microtubule organization protein AKNA-like isoform X2 n=1 Tax=Channa argus TaxID=215402 RepID=UPI0035229689